MKLARAILPGAVIGALLLTGCSGGSPSEDASGEACTAPGKASDAVKVTGDFGASEITLDSKLPLRADKVERTVITQGEGDVVADGDMMKVTITMFNGATGDVLNSIPGAEAAYDTLSFASDPTLGPLLRCATAGQRAASVVPVSELLQGQSPEDIGLTGMTEEDAIVVVMDMQSVTEGDGEAAGATGEPGTLTPEELLQKAEGKAVKAPEGFPAVELAEDGSPTITMPEGVDAPTELQVATLIEGDGEEVQDGDRVYVNYRGVIWRTGEEFDSSWSRGAPTDFVTSQVIGGFQKALVGQKVGSQVIAVVPAEDGGYGAASLEQMGHEPDDVMVFVLDILGTVHAE